MSSTVDFHSSFSTLGVPTIDLTEDHPLKALESQLSGSSRTVPIRNGLPTPPHDMTGITYNAMPPIAYGGKPNGVPSHIYGHSRPHDSVSSSMAMKPQSHTAAKEPASEPTAQKKPTGTTGSQLRIPSSINNSKGSLAEFAAQMTCLFWFEKTSKLQAIEDRQPQVPSLVPEAVPTVGFQKWVATILSTTQVSQNVILLALLFIYRLKKFNSGVKGKKGSEFRLMTVALMLGNKYLDDNTYTNKTWAEVSGIAVHEIHIMEVEFLSNIRYDLFSSEAEWDQWHTKLGLFGDYFNQASMLSVEPAAMLRVSPPRMQSQSPSSKLPSPGTDIFRSQPQPNWYMPPNALPYSLPPQQPQRMAGEAAMGGSRKRSRDENDELHPTKRAVLSATTSAPSMTAPVTAMNAMPTLPPVLTPTSAPVAPMNVSRLPPPHHPPSLPTSYPAPQTLPPTAPSHLPAIMPPIYNRPANWQQMPPLSVPPMQSSMYNTPSLPELGRHHQSPFGVSSATVSPAGSTYSVHTPQTHLSPSFFLANRNSPYRPVRSVNTLLIPPPPSSLQQQRNVPFDHMHYQPLGKGNTSRKTGLLPYIQPDAWNQAPYLHPIYPPTGYSG
ncbi:uncharacterized protein N7500_005612 [Penicillium coprophilum]|uniref:uncharacterized protein n=1 Tax=Penicillium coprophilum TaxID=36646 RepID=UPI00238BC597|nr:uncharacterized protein N7500_005612 [Penicillium coprophilum]KAJ5163782.1 hypothetical protein N7500_005612 [Penicillium coprophilum]